MRRFSAVGAILAILVFGLPKNVGAVEPFDSPINCSTVRLDQGTGPFGKLPVYNQALEAKTDPNICYAIAAS